ncbi:hypothetical protein Peur_007335 [Populus x canadensis]
MGQGEIPRKNQSIIVSVTLVFRERKKERTDIKLSGLDNAGNSVPFLHGLDFREISSFCWPLNLKGTQLSFESFFPFLLPKS